MHFPDQLLRVLENAPVQPFSGFVYRIIAERHRDSPLSAIGSVRCGGRYNAPDSFPVLYCADSQMTAMLEVDALFTTADGQLKGAPRDPDLVLSLHCNLVRVLDLTDEHFHRELGNDSSRTRQPVAVAIHLERAWEGNANTNFESGMLFQWPHLSVEGSQRSA